MEPLPLLLLYGAALLISSLVGGALPQRLWEQALTALRTMEEQTGKRFGDPANPLLVS